LKNIIDKLFIRSLFWEPTRSLGDPSGSTHKNSTEKFDRRIYHHAKFEAKQNLMKGEKEKKNHQLNSCDYGPDMHSCLRDYLYADFSFPFLHPQIFV
jgi:hypothetical protein